MFKEKTFLLAYGEQEAQCTSARRHPTPSLITREVLFDSQQAGTLGPAFPAIPIVKHPTFSSAVERFLALVRPQMVKISVGQ